MTMNQKTLDALYWLVLELQHNKYLVNMRTAFSRVDDSIVAMKNRPIEVACAIPSESFGIIIRIESESEKSINLWNIHGDLKVPFESQHPMHQAVLIKTIQAITSASPDEIITNRSDGCDAMNAEIQALGFNLEFDVQDEIIHKSFIDLKGYVKSYYCLEAFKYLKLMISGGCVSMSIQVLSHLKEVNGIGDLLTQIMEMNLLTWGYGLILVFGVWGTLHYVMNPESCLRCFEYASMCETPLRIEAVPPKQGGAQFTWFQKSEPTR